MRTHELRREQQLPGTPAEVFAFLRRRLPLSWLTSIQAWEAPNRFVDQQVRGPYALWHHTHTFAPTGGGDTVMTDLVRYAIGFGAAGELAHRLAVQRDLAAIFAYRAARVPELLAAERRAVGLS